MPMTKGPRKNHYDRQTESTTTAVMIRCATLLLMVVVAGCAADVRPGLYEGFRVRNDLQNSPAERLGQPDSPNYAEYERLKKEQAH